MKLNIAKLVKASKQWKIPIQTVQIVIERDSKCVYCGCEFDDSARAKKASWEHIINDITINGSNNIALCCIGCNASKGTKDLNDWLSSERAKARGAKRPDFLL